MPALGMAQDTGKLIRWLKTEGQQVSKGEPLMEVETDKATVEIEAPASGTLSTVTAREGDVIPVAQVIALILPLGETAPPAPTIGSSPATQALPASPELSPKIAASPLAARIAQKHQVDLGLVKASHGDRISKADVLAYVEARQPDSRGKDANGRIAASPKARRLAAERGLDLTVLSGSGPLGAILAADIPATSPAPPSAGNNLAVSRAWQAMAERLSAGWATVPHFYLVREVEATRLIAWRERLSAKIHEKVTYTDLLVKIVAAALKQHPRANGAWQDDSLMLNTDINIGLAVAVEEGLLVPVIHQADRLKMVEIAARRRTLIERANAGKLRLDDLQGGTFTLSNLGMYGVDAFNAIVNPPQAAILAVGRIADRVVPADGLPAVRPMMILSLSCDHRAIDGARGAQFLETVASFIEEPISLIE